MKKSNFILNTSLALFSTCILLMGCKKSTDEVVLKNPTSDQSAGVNITATKAEDAVLDSGSANARMASANYISFDDRGACEANPDICNNSFVYWPGYIQNVGLGNSTFGYAWMSSGPGTAFISPTNTSLHYHIGGLAFPKEEPNPHASAMFGSDWFAFYMQRGFTDNRKAIRINFNLTQILVQNVPITLWFKTASGSWRYWAKLNPGRWNLPGAGNIQEFHIRAASGLSRDHWEIDDIAVQPVIQ